MKFIVDAQLPKSSAYFLCAEKDSMPFIQANCAGGNDTTDAEINRLSLTENRIVVSKDTDFYDSFTAKKEPYKLLHVKTGNIRNSQMIELFDKNIELIIKESNQSSVVQISQNYIIKIQ